MGFLRSVAAFLIVVLLCTISYYPLTHKYEPINQSIIQDEYHTFVSNGMEVLDDTIDDGRDFFTMNEGQMDVNEGKYFWMGDNIVLHLGHGWIKYEISQTSESCKRDRTSRG
jgi:hypothetical protein